MTGEVIKSFLVGLGFGVDDASLAKFNKSIVTATLKVTALYTATRVAAAGIAAGIAKVSEGFEQMGYEYRIIAPAINKALLLRRELLKAYSAAGINITKVIQDSVKLNFSLAKTRFAFKAIYESVASKFFGLLTKQSDTFRQKLYANMPKIQAALERFVKFVFKALEATTQLGNRVWSILSRVFDFFVALDEKTSGWSTIVLAVLAAWHLLNLEFLATPLGMIITGLVAILALFDDFKTWQEGGKSLFDWSAAVPYINAVTASLDKLWGVLQSISDAIGEVLLAFYQLAKGDFSGAWESIIGVIHRLDEAIMGVINSLTGLGRFGEFLGHLLGGPLAGNLISNIQSAPQGVPAVSPIGSGNVSNSQTNQHVQQQTSISVVGSADAQAVGKSVASEQSKVNYDLVRNLKGATR